MFDFLTKKEEEKQWKENQRKNSFLLRIHHRMLSFTWPPVRDVKILSTTHDSEMWSDHRHVYQLGGFWTCVSVDLEVRIFQNYIAQVHTYYSNLNATHKVLKPMWKYHSENVHSEEDIHWSLFRRCSQRWIGELFLQFLGDDIWISNPLLINF